MQKILVGVDLSASSEVAIQHALVVARHVGAEVVLAMATSMPDQPAVQGSAYAAYTAATHEALAGDHGKLGDVAQRWTGQGVPVSQVIVDGRADDVLPDLARSLHADLIVVGSHGRTGLARLAMGSVAERVVRFAPCSVYVARGPTPANGIRRVVVGTDFEPTAPIVIAQASALVASAGDLDLITCWHLVPMRAEPPMAAVYDGDALRTDVATDLTARATTLLAAVRHRDHRTSFRIMEQGPAWGVIEAAIESTADLIVIGSHGRRGLQRWLLGSVAETIVRHAPCSVLVARRPLAA